MTKRQLKARNKELEDMLDHFEEEQREISKMLKETNEKFEKFAYEGTIGPVDGDRLLALLISLTIKFDMTKCMANTLLNRIIDILPKYKLTKEK